MRLSRANSNSIKLHSSNANVQFLDAGNMNNEEPPHPQYLQGHQEGYEACKTEYELKLQALQDQLAAKDEQFQKLQVDMVNNLSESLVGLGNDMKQSMIETAFNLSETLLSRELEDKSNIESSISEVLSSIIDIDGVSLSLSPEDKQLLNSEQLGIPIKVDQRLSCGEFILESKQGYLDGRWQSRLSELKKQFLSYIESQECSVE